ncbi:MAG: sulfite exporter TauE/SafE family protein [Pirellulales bacterium]|nr:sulfite exporter TauE/SafE family protein [Pirellulales bacterium]
MRRPVILACCIWLTVLVSVAVSFLFWRIGYIRPHAAWAMSSLIAIVAPVLGLFWHVARGPGRLRTLGWLLIGVTPLVWIGAYFTHLYITSKARQPIDLNTPLRIAATYGSAVFDIEARLRYSRWTHGKHAILMDAGQTPNAERLVTEMDAHIVAMAKLLGQPVPDYKYPCVRGSLFGRNREAVLLWALCGQPDDPDELTYLDRHELGHTLITTMGGPDQDPPFVLIEGWAESQSADRNYQITDLVKKRKNGQAYSLEELVGPDWYGTGDGPVYWQGGPLVHYLMEHYGPEKFLELYTGVRRPSFHADCQKILGDSWATVEENFWPWLEAEASEIAKQNPAPEEQPTPKAEVKFADGVDPADWQALVTQYQNTKEQSDTLPKNLAFLAEVDRTVTDEKMGLTKQPAHFELWAIFKDKHLWIAENYSGYADQFLMIADRQSARLWKHESGVMRGSVKGSQGAQNVRLEAEDTMRLFRGFDNPANVLPLGKDSQLSGICLITRLERPEVDSDAPWNVSFEWQPEDDSPITKYQFTIDPSSNWLITHYIMEYSNGTISTAEKEYQRLDGFLLPSKTSGRHFNSDNNNEVLVEIRWRALTEQEQSKLQQHVERIVQAGPTPPHQKLRSWLWVAVVGCPLIGGLLVVLTCLRQ